VVDGNKRDVVGDNKSELFGEFESVKFCDKDAMVVGDNESAVAELIEPVVVGNGIEYEPFFVPGDNVFWLSSAEFSESFNFGNKESDSKEFVEFRDDWFKLETLEDKLERVTPTFDVVVGVLSRALVLDWNWVLFRELEVELVIALDDSFNEANSSGDRTEVVVTACWTVLDVWLLSEELFWGKDIEFVVEGGCSLVCCDDDSGNVSVVEEGISMLVVVENWGSVVDDRTDSVVIEGVSEKVLYSVVKSQKTVYL